MGPPGQLLLVYLFLTSKGAPGRNGPRGPPGRNGVDGRNGTPGVPGKMGLVGFIPPPVTRLSPALKALQASPACAVPPGATAAPVYPAPAACRALPARFAVAPPPFLTPSAWRSRPSWPCWTCWPCGPRIHPPPLRDTCSKAAQGLSACQGAKALLALRVRVGSPA
jgi:hypothetical protein